MSHLFSSISSTKVSLNTKELKRQRGFILIHRHAQITGWKEWDLEKIKDKGIYNRGKNKGHVIM